MLFSFTFRLKQTQSSVMCHVVLKVTTQTYSPRGLWTVTVFLSLFPTRSSSDLFSFLFLPPSYYQLPSLTQCPSPSMQFLSVVPFQYPGLTQQHIAPGLKIPCCLCVHPITNLPNRNSSEHYSVITQFTIVSECSVSEIAMIF